MSFMHIHTNEGTSNKFFSYWMESVNEHRVSFMSSRQYMETSGKMVSIPIAIILNSFSKWHISVRRSKVLHDFMIE